MSRGKDKEAKNKKVEKILKEDAKGEDQETSPDALAKIREQTGAAKEGNGKAKS